MILFKAFLIAGVTMVALLYLARGRSPWRDRFVVVVLMKSGYLSVWTKTSDSFTVVTRPDRRSCASVDGVTKPKLNSNLLVVRKFLPYRF